MNPGEHPRRRALLLALEAAEDAMKRLPMTDKRRGEVAKRIVQIEAALDAVAEEDIADYPQPPAAPARPDRGWQRFGDVACNIVSGLIGGGAMLLAVGAAVFALRLL
jgi:hypothetical protein